MSAPKAIHELVERFDLHKDQYRSGRFNETQLRRDFLDPFFEALGWDVSNKSGYAEAYRDVIHEDAIKVGGATKAPDYCFRTGGTRKFFVEAKKPGVNLKADPLPAYQLRRYGWSAKLPLSILTDFEEFVVYDCRQKPDTTDKASAARVLYLDYTEYAERWDEIAGVFSREAVLKGSFDKYADSAKKKRGTAEVDDAFLAEIDGWRELLAKNIALRNPDLGVRDLNYAVQKTIDRIIFLRICEARGIEGDDRLKALLNGPKTYARLAELFDAADVRYNSGLFHFHAEKNRAEPPDEWTLSLKIDDKPLKDILKHLYYPESPYEFSVLPADILGQVYERFLGKVIRLTSGGAAKVEEKPEVRKAGGVYYTPTYIVEYTVENTVGKLLDGAEVKQVERRDRRLDRSLRVLDPACGSGSFLLVAYQRLLDWHLAWYLGHDPEKLAVTANPPIRMDHRGAWRLTTAERKRILLDHVFGVDIDAQAVEVTKLSLLLKVLEGETRETLQRQLFAKERALPDLASNIKCGNSLIGPDFYRTADRSLFGEEQRYRINAFDWSAEFPLAVKSGGFDAVVGNPPYVLLQTLGMPEVFRYLGSTYSAAAYKIDTYQVFMERAFSLLANGGHFGYITPNTYLRNKHARPLREYLLRHAEVNALVLFDYNVFRGVSVDTCVTVAEKAATPAPSHAVRVERWQAPRVVTSRAEVREGDWAKRDDLNFDVSRTTDSSRIIEQIMEASVPLGTFATAYFGIQTFDRSRFVDRHSHNRHWKPALDGSNISRYFLDEPVEYVDSRPEAIKSGGKRDVHEQERIGVRQIGRHPVATLLPAGWYSLNTIYNIYFTRPVDYHLNFVLGIISSRPIRWYWESLYFDQKRTFPKIKKEPLLAIPIPEIDFERQTLRAKHDSLTKCVSEMLTACAAAKRAKTPQQVAIALRQVSSIDRQIDEIVYELYGLGDDEIAIIDAATGA